MSSIVSDTGLSVNVGLLLRAVWPENTAKHAARAMGKSPRTVEDWMQGRFAGPNYATLLRLLRQNDQARTAFVRLLNDNNASEAHEGMQAMAAASMASVRLEPGSATRTSAASVESARRADHAGAAGAVGQGRS